MSKTEFASQDLKDRVEALEDYISIKFISPTININGVTLTNYQSYIQNGRLYFSGNVVNNSGAALPKYQDILNMNISTDIFAGNAIDVYDNKDLICMIQHGKLRFGTAVPNGHTAWVNVSARVTT